jgi:hypothetical protein
MCFTMVDNWHYTAVVEVLTGKGLGQKVYNILLQLFSKIKLNKFNGFIREKNVLNGMDCNCWNVLIVGKQTRICIAAPVSFIIS